MGTGRKNQIRRRIAAEAARIIVQQEAADIPRARYKAAHRLGFTHRRDWPDHDEISAAVRAYQQTFCARRQPAALHELRTLAVSAMEALSDFQPRLTGAVLEGYADENSTINLLLTADTPEDVIFSLHDRHIPWQEEEERLDFPQGRQALRPRYRITAGGRSITLTVLRPEDRSSPPLDTDTGRPLAGATIAQVLELLEQAPFSAR